MLNAVDTFIFNAFEIIFNGTHLNKLTIYAFIYFYNTSTLEYNIFRFL